ncbi:hypothetical protein [Massilia violaceinigra]|uniref:hypothetical protein n=1 Tax=Massilia violaceinigra TaxID=2045208 RepID=UPI0012FDA705|nr:hypothetical protein [Massilia violaceinigra]
MLQPHLRNQPAAASDGGLNESAPLTDGASIRHGVQPGCKLLAAVAFAMRFAAAFALALALAGAFTLAFALAALVFATAINVLQFSAD